MSFEGGQTRKRCFLAMFPEGGQTRKRCFLAMLPKGGQTRKRCFLATFSEGGQTRKHCSLAMFSEGGQTRKHFFPAMFPDGGQTKQHCFLTMFLEGCQTSKHCFLVCSIHNKMFLKLWRGRLARMFRNSYKHFSYTKLNIVVFISFLLERCGVYSLGSALADLVRAAGRRCETLRRHWFLWSTCWSEHKTSM